MSRHLTPFSFLRAQRSGPLHVRAQLPQASGHPGLDSEVWLAGCPCALGFPFIAVTHTGLVLSPFHVFVFLSSLRARMCICPPPSFGPPTRGACVCVCVCV